MSSSSNIHAPSACERLMNFYNSQVRNGFAIQGSGGYEDYKNGMELHLGIELGRVTKLSCEVFGENKEQFMRVKAQGPYFSDGSDKTFITTLTPDSEKSGDDFIHFAGKGTCERNSIHLHRHPKEDEKRNLSNWFGLRQTKPVFNPSWEDSDLNKK